MHLIMIKFYYNSLTYAVSFDDAYVLYRILPHSRECKRVFITNKLLTLIKLFSGIVIP